MLQADVVDGFIESRLPAWHGLLQALVRERSVFEHEHGVLEVLVRHITGLGLEPIRVFHMPEVLARLPEAQGPISHVPGRHSLVVHLPGRGGGRRLGLSAHVDIVPEGNPTAWSYPPFGASIDAEQRLYGRGSMDGKAGAAIVLAVLETLLEMRFRLDGDLLCYFVIEDETTGNGSLLCLDNGYLPDAAVIIDGTRGDRAIDRHAGQIQFALYVQGKAASVCVSHLGVNAADLLARLVARLADAVVALNATRTGDWLRYPSPFQLVTQRLASEGAQLTVPEMAQATCYMTFPPPWTIGRTLTFLDAEVAAFAARHQLSDPPCMRVLFRAEPVASEASEMVGVLRRSAVDAGFGSVETSPSTGTSDLRHFVARGIPCVLYGPGGGANPHRPDEYYDLGDLPRMVRLFVDFASRWCGTAA